ncbi:hypothetical protein N6H18_05555 [Reichenbachiella agarivorans]|uniref:Lipocalin-like domain-containing protein n=1 Tax=Reichenbachiella agarivorans TaxID=2979464 RepID=A0ABY6CSC1_9BACT|nr:hypothetical protein [Reichenbachiella agarivorans]UXP33417.1 hypothetical protein N6H18_05555 [Reichenbachiella agarivorans]
MKKLSILLLAIVLFAACSTDKKESTESTDLKKEEQIEGKWMNLSLLVTMKRLNNKDSVLLANEGEWEKILKIKPIETTFNADSTFASQYYTVDGQNFNTVYGKWWIENDSLVMLSEEGTTKYKYEIRGNRVRFKATLDWDGDGIANDEYDGVQVRMD